MTEVSEQRFSQLPSPHSTGSWAGKLLFLLTTVRRGLSPHMGHFQGGQATCEQ